MTTSFFQLPTIIDFCLSNYLLNIGALLLFIISLKLIFSKNLLENIVIMSFFSLLISLLYLLMDAPDVAMTEVALGAFLSTCVYLSFLSNLPESAKIIKSTNVIPASIICIIFIVIMTYIGLDLPTYGNAESPLNTHISKYYIEHTKQEIGVGSFVAALLASYRGYDTLGETAVIFIAGISVLLLFSRKNHA